jgi:hypothetical protein
MGLEREKMSILSMDLASYSDQMWFMRRDNPNHDKPKEKYYHLHFNLGTTFQQINVGTINYLNHDLRYQLTDLHQVPLKKEPQVIKDADEESVELKLEAKKETAAKKGNSKRVK